MNINKERDIVNATSALILKKDVTEEDVARAMIQNGYQQQPFYIFDMDKVYQCIQRFKSMLPRVDIFFAMKSNDNPMMHKLAVAMGVGFDCASPGEIAKIRQMNVSPRSIIYAMTSKAPDQMAYARSAGVLHTTFDSSYELKKIKLYWPEAKLLLRVRVDSDSAHKLGEKFGCNNEIEAIELLEQAASLDLKVIGVAFHVGSGCFSTNSHVVGLKYARALFDHEKRAGREMKIVDIGGGFLETERKNFEKVCQLINETLEELFPDPEVQIIAEPGRYLCDTSFTLYCNISNVSTNKIDDKTINMVHINDGYFGTLSYIEPWYEICKFQKTKDSNNGKLEEVVLIGPTGDPRDRITLSQEKMLPRLEVDDWIRIERQGSYTFSMAKRFPSRESPLVRSVISFQLWNKIKNCSVFDADDFVMNYDVSTPLPLNLPPLIPRPEIQQDQ